MGVGVGQKHSQSAKRDYVPLSLLKMKTEHTGGESVMVLVHLSIYCGQFIRRSLYPPRSPVPGNLIQSHATHGVGGGGARVFRRPQLLPLMCFFLIKESIIICFPSHFNFLQILLLYFYLVQFGKFSGFATDFVFDPRLFITSVLRFLDFFFRDLSVVDFCFHFL